ncbi:TRAP transporter small permease [Bordetella sp. 15P40C-2]|uniref:TRAP transporter small permease n=1 Tax=Bordetella sp. 15P40C-2 TaxID=2572246 RepID=UPI0013235656|nr:TRAP transporter small permease subunit [Bordetella sp. 15P40C-2]MVW72364.1 TRAP transporter small permease subunit [Bordetella sp. 15P40C-2]
MTRASITKIFDRVIEVTTLAGGIAVVLMMIHITADIVLRFFSSAPPGTISIVSYYYMLIVTFISLAFAERRNAHIAVDIVYDHLPRALQACCRVVSRLLCIAIFGLMTVKSWDIAMEKLRIGSRFIQGSSVIITWPGYFLLPLGLGLLCLTYVMKLLRVLTEAPPSDLEEEMGHE